MSAENRECYNPAGAASERRSGAFGKYVTTKKIIASNNGHMRAY